ncbi:MAG: response regulator, partial [Rickettsiales bacterium]
MSSSLSDFRPEKALNDVHVLVVDDDLRIAKLVRSVLEGLGFQHVRLCHDGSEALEVLKNETVDMVICDWQMEPMSGLSMVEYVRSPQSPCLRIPVIMLSGNSERPQVEIARDSGVTEYVMKPFTAKSLCSRIVAAIDHPRSFILSKNFSGPNRRRKKVAV